VVYFTYSLDNEVFLSTVLMLNFIDNVTERERESERERERERESVRERERETDLHNHNHIRNQIFINTPLFSLYFSVIITHFPVKSIQTKA